MGCALGAAGRASGAGGGLGELPQIDRRKLACGPLPAVPSWPGQKMPKCLGMAEVARNLDFRIDLGRDYGRPQTDSWHMCSSRSERQGGLRSEELRFMHSRQRRRRRLLKRLSLASSRRNGQGLVRALGVAQLPNGPLLLAEVPVMRVFSNR